jgi:hypothetical protein
MSSGDVMVVPAQGGQVGRVVVAAVGAVSDVVGLEPVPAATPLDGAPAVAAGDEGSDRARDGVRRV